MNPRNFTRSGLQLSLLTLALLASPWALAQDDTSWYAGVSVGHTRATIDDARILGSLGANGFPDATISDSNNDTGYKVFGGYRFNRNFALEGSYFDLGKFGYTARSTPANTLTGQMQLRGVGLDAVLIAPLTERFSVFGKVGAQYSEARDSFSSTGAIIVGDRNPNKSELNPKLGVGLQYAFSDALSVRAELERYRVNDAVGNRGDIDHLSVGLVYSWGQPRKTAPVAAPAPVQVVEAAAPPVVVVPAPTPAPPPVARAVPVVPAKVTLAADSLFAFDQSAVSPGGRQQLDAFADQLKTLDYEVVTVTGHTDRIGSPAYNQKLSTRRAEAAGSYLVQVRGIPEGKVLARGQSDSNPVTKPGDCVGTQPTKALIACLQPDRRVDLEVTGTHGN